MVYAIEINSSTFAPAKFATVASLMNIIVSLLITGAAVIFLTMFLWGAWRWMTAGENPEMLKAAQKTFIFAIFGLGIVLSSFLVVKLLGKILGFENILPL